MMHPSSNINTSNNLYDPLRVLEDNNCYYYYSSPSFFPTSPSLYHGLLHGDENKVQTEFFQDFIENHHEMIQQKHQQNSLENINYNDEISKSKRIISSSPRKKICKKDRHTKIETAQGPRDRRMRLSLNVARKFFDLQDMLGFDKASKTVEWLLTNSSSAITELSRNFHQIGANSSLSCSTSEIVMDELSSTNNKNSEAKKPNKKVIRSIRPLAKESREKARERARERTMQKRTNLQKRREFAGTTYVAADNGSSLVDASCWIPSTTFLNHQQNGGIINELSIPELEHLSGNFGETFIW